MGTPETDPGEEVTISGADFALLQHELKMLRKQLECVRDNLNRGMGKSLQKMQAKAIAEVLAGDYE